MKFIEGARTWRSILGTQTFFWPLTHPPTPPPPRYSINQPLSKGLVRTWSGRVPAIVARSSFVFAGQQLHAEAGGGGAHNARVHRGERGRNWASHGNVGRQVADDRDDARGSGATGPHAHGNAGETCGGRLECGGEWAAETVERPPQQPAHPQCANRWALRTRKRPHTGRGGRQNAATQRSVRREERVTVHSPVKKQQPDGMSHRGGY